MRAAVFHELGKPLRIETVDNPKAGSGEIVLKVHYCGVCGSDLHSTHPGVFVVPDGAILGHEFAGEIVESGAPGWKVGEMATALPNNACEDCRKLGLGECKDNLGIMCPKNALTGFHPSAQGGYAEFVKFSAKEALRLPSAVKSWEGAAVEPPAVGLHAVNRGKVSVGERVLIMEGGPDRSCGRGLLEARSARDVIVSEYVHLTRRTRIAGGDAPADLRKPGGDGLVLERWLQGRELFRRRVAPRTFVASDAPHTAVWSLDIDRCNRSLRDDAVAAAALAINPNVIVLGHGGPPRTTDAIRSFLLRSRCQGYASSSSLEGEPAI